MRCLRFPRGVYCFTDVLVKAAFNPLQITHLKLGRTPLAHQTLECCPQGASPATTVMSRWRRLPFTLLALWAMLLTLTPQMAWACPMTGRVDVAERVCLGSKSIAPGAAPCQMPCAGSGKCCKPVQVPASHSTDSQHPQFLASAGEQVIFAPVFVAPFTPGLAALPAQEALSPLIRVYLARFNNLPPPFWTQYRPLSLVGRAPPVL
jgi:hypothetical protein